MALEMFSCLVLIETDETDITITVLQTLKLFIFFHAMSVMPAQLPAMIKSVEAPVTGK
jgi:hypothetical protein